MNTSPNRTLFSKATSSRNFPKLDNSQAQTVDVLVIGAGFTGLTAAMRLMREGKTVMVVDQHEVGGGESASSTAQLTEFIDARYYQLIEDFGHEQARHVARSTWLAIEWVSNQVSALKIHCGLERVPAYLYCDNVNDVREIEMEFVAMGHSDLPVVRKTSLAPGFRSEAALMLQNQLQLNPRQYLDGLARHLSENKIPIFENTRVTEIEDGPTCLVKTADGGTIVAKDVIVATHTPICNLVFLHTKLAAYRSYVIAVSLKGSEPPTGLYFDTAKPYHYIRRVQTDEGPLWLIGGEDHKTGTLDDTEACYDRLERFARARFDVERVHYRWSGQVLESVDHLPFIGRNSASEHLYVGTGYGGNGTTFGTLAGMIVADQILGRANPWAGLYSATRVKPIAGAANFVSENADAAYRFFRDRLSKQDYESFQSMPLNCGSVFDMDGKKVAVYRDETGYFFNSAVCPHLSCIVHWNGSEKTWDCPCHGARFQCKGELINGPAMKNLQPVDILKM